VNLASGVAYVGGRTGEGRAQAAGADDQGRRSAAGGGRQNRDVPPWTWLTACICNNRLVYTGDFLQLKY